MTVKRLLVANRGEIACRVFQTCKELGITAIGIFTKEDHQARHVSFADELIEVKSYLDAKEITEKALKANVNLVHPGYGFLSERPHFVELLEKSGLVFLGPSAPTMKTLGEKIAAKELAEKSKVPTLPWAKVKNQDELKTAAKKIGYPLLLKASAGGGGKGMRRVDHEKDLLSQAESASAEAQSAFGDQTLFLEKLVENPRHIEVQIFGDGHGNGVHLFERECSLQRRHQKIWEEAPASNLSQKTKDALYRAALSIVSATNYRSAGTVEFLVDDQEGFYFLEMNTRLQVEHPVTESITGVDLVRAQIELALEPKKLPTIPKNPTAYSIEVRLYAEDPSQGFIPTPGTVSQLRWPTGAFIRVDSGVEEGQKIETQFDSMLAKLIVSGQTRKETLERMRYALDQTVILGCGTNQSYLRALCDLNEVIEAKVTTKTLLEKMGHYRVENKNNALSSLLYFSNQNSVPSQMQSETQPLAWNKLSQGDLT